MHGYRAKEYWVDRLQQNGPFMAAILGLREPSTAIKIAVNDLGDQLWCDKLDCGHKW